MVFSDFYDGFEDLLYAVRFPGRPSGPAAGPSGGTAVNLHFPKEFQRFPVVPQLQSVFFFFLQRFRDVLMQWFFLTFTTFLKISSMP